MLSNGEAIRESAGTRSWEQAERNARKKEAEADPTRAEQVQVRRTMVKEAVRMCLEDEEARGLELSSRKKSRTLLERQFLPFCEARKFIYVDRLLPIDLTEFRSTWNNGHRKHERMHSFFAFCVANDLLRKKPMDALKKPKTPDIVPTDYFLPEDGVREISVEKAKEETSRQASCKDHSMRTLLECPVFMLIPKARSGSDVMGDPSDVTYLSNYVQHPQIPLVRKSLYSSVSSYSPFAVSMSSSGCGAIRLRDRPSVPS